MKKMERRNFLRVPVKIRMLARYEGEETGQLYFFSKNLSAGGVFLESDLLLEKGTKIYIEFVLPSDQRLIIVKSEVVWIKEDTGQQPFSTAGMGISFINLDEENRKAIVDFIKTNLK